MTDPTSPLDFLINGLWAALDNAGDMRLDGFRVEYAVGSIVVDVLSGTPDSEPDSGYLFEQYDDNDNVVTFTRRELRPHLEAAVRTVCQSS